MPRPFELTPADLSRHLEDSVDATFADLQSQFLVLPKGSHFVEYGDFQEAYEVLKSHTGAFQKLSEGTVWAALEKDSLAFMVLRTILGLSPPEWADLARAERGSDIDQGTARGLDTRVRRERGMFERMRRGRGTLTLKRSEALVSVAVEYIARGAAHVAMEAVHRLAKVDTSEGLRSVCHAASEHVPYAVLLYERYLGRPFASHRDSVSGLVGNVMEEAIEAHLRRARITFRRTGLAERIPGFALAPDFFVPTEFAPAVVIEAKITGDDGTARDKVTRILRLAGIRDARARTGETGFQLAACVDGRGFGVRRQDMRDMLTATEGKVFTLSTLDSLIPHTRLREFLPS